MSRFGRALIVPALAVVAAACTARSSEPPDLVPSAPGLGAFEEMACGLPSQQLLRIWRGSFPGRSGNIQIVPNEPNYMSGGFSHSGPWEYLQRVPMLWYGPGYVPAASKVRRPVTMADVAPTIASYLGYDFKAADGTPMTEALLSEGGRGKPPRLVLVVVWDGGGRNVLSEYPDAWPNLRRLIRRGAWYENATVGSSPSATPPIHTTLGTGAFPRHHGLVDLKFKVGGKIVPSHEDGPKYLEIPSIADRYDRDMENEPKVAMVGFRAWHLGMIGQGSFLEGADRDLAALMEGPTAEWNLPAPNSRYFEFPAYVNDVPGLEQAVRAMDLQDGQLDGAWLGEEVVGVPDLLKRTPAYTEWQTLILEEIIRREQFGSDDVPDLIFTNYKQIDEVGHRWTMNSPQMEEVVKASDQALGDLVAILNRDVGKGRWVIAVTADHGVLPKPKLTGAFAIPNSELVGDIEATFGGNVVKAIRPSQLWIDGRVLARKGYSLEQVAEYVAEYTKGQTVKDPSKLGPEDREERVFSAAFPSTALKGLPCLPRGEAA
ncbi:MAG TPA: alkaline phosphatase family protein [Actinomycetota bacterium]|nr:alkaline phosphatase family protein [Actinomycetota bacterium]